MKKILVSECSALFWIDVFKNLKKQYNWEPVYWIESFDYVDPSLIKEVFPDVILHHNYDAVKGISAESFKDIDLPAVDADLLNEFARHESVVLTMMNRMDPANCFGHNERKRLYLSYLRYWSYIIDVLKPDVFFSPVTPHLCYDYILYQLCRHKQVECLFFIETPIPCLMFPANSFEEASPEVLATYNELLASDAPVELMEEHETYIQKAMKPYNEAIPFWMVDQLKQANNQKGILNVVFKKAKQKFEGAVRKIKLIANNKPLSYDVNTYYKIPGRNIEDNILKARPYHKGFLKGLKKNNELLKRRYDELSVSPDLGAPFVYVPLMYQPERTSSPDGGIFVDQYLMVEWLSRQIPAGWKVYVKEHPSQFIFPDQVRSQFMYEDLLKLGNVSLVKINADPFELVDKSKAVATLTGTAGLEAVLRLKPLLCFGHAWFRNCEGVFTIDSIKSLQKAIGFVRKGFIPDIQKIRKFIRAIEIAGIKGYVDPYYGKGFNFDEQTNIQNLTSKIFEYYSTVYSSPNRILEK